MKLHKLEIQRHTTVHGISIRAHAVTSMGSVLSTGIEGLEGRSDEELDQFAADELKELIEILKRMHISEEDVGECLK